MDHQEARLFHVDAEHLDEHTIKAPAHHLHRHAKGAAAEHNHPEDLHKFFQSVAHELQGAERILVLGPSTAKLQFVRYAAKHDATLESRIVGLETVDHPTDGQILAYAKRYFEADEHMMGHHVAGAKPKS